MFDEMIATIREDAVHMLLTIEVRQQNQEPKREQVAKPTGEGAPAQAGAKGATPCARDQDWPQRSLPLRQRPEMEKMHLQRVSP